MRNTRLLFLGAAGALIVAALLWALFGYSVQKLTAARTLHAAEALDFSQNEERARASARLHALVRDTANEQEIFEELARTDVLAAVEAIEAAGKAAGAVVTVRGATAAPLNGASKSKTIKDLRAIEILVDAEGKFQSLIKAASIFEALPFLSSIDRLQFEENLSSSDGKKSADAWRMTARIRIITTSTVGI